MSRLLRLLHTFTFRLGLVYVGLFSLSVVLLFGFIYTFASNYIENQIADAIRVRYSVLVNEYRENGSSGLEARINEFIKSDDEGTEIYLVINNKDEKLAGNMEAWPQHAVIEGRFEKNAHWSRFNIEGTRKNPGSIEVRAISVPLSSWRSLLVGQSMLSKRKVEQTIMQAFWASLAVTFGMAFLGAFIMTKSVMRRLAVINRSAETIMSGALSARIPFSPGGDEFDELSQTLNRMLDKIEMLLASLSQFANNIAHDLRSPLNRIVARTEAGLRGMKEASAARRLLERNVEEMQEMISTFNSILNLSELEANTDFRRFERCDLRWIVERLAEFYEPLAAEKSVTLENRITREIIVEGEKNLLTQAFANLIDNAIKFTPEGGRVRVEAELGEEHAAIVISDTGPGIPAEYRDKVFEKFFRLEMSRSAKGNGLGLSLAAAVARIHGARITLADNAPGLKVRIIFPLYAKEG